MSRGYKPPGLWGVSTACPMACTSVVLWPTLLGRHGIRQRDGFRVSWLILRNRTVCSGPRLLCLQCLSLSSDISGVTTKSEGIWKKLLKAKIAVALHDELGTVPKEKKMRPGLSSWARVLLQSRPGATLQAAGAEEKRAAGNLLKHIHTYVDRLRARFQKRTKPSSATRRIEKGRVSREEPLYRQSHRHKTRKQPRTASALAPAGRGYIRCVATGQIRGDRSNT